MTRFPVLGLTTTYSGNSQVTDSAAAGTALATGHKTSNGTISMDAKAERSYVTIAELAKARGMKVGIVSSTSLNDATPAAFYAHQPSRYDRHELAHQLANSNVDYFAGSGVSGSKGPMGDAVEMAVANGFTVVRTRKDLAACRPGQRVLFHAWVPYAIDRPPDRVTLAELTRKGIEMLEGPEGFFMMVEGARIDGAGHTNDARAVVGDVCALDEAVQTAVAFYRKHPLDTLILVTADHETGGLALGCRGAKSPLGIASLAAQKHSWGKFNADVFRPYREKQAWTSSESDMPASLKRAIRQHFGLDYDELSDEQKARLEEAYDCSMSRKGKDDVKEWDHPVYGNYEPFPLTTAQVVSQRAGIGWTTLSHTAIPVPVWALGAGAYRFDGLYDNTDVPKKLAETMRLTFPEPLNTVTTRSR